MTLGHRANMSVVSNIENGMYMYRFNLPHHCSAVKWNFQENARVVEVVTVSVIIEIRLGIDNIIREERMNSRNEKHK